MNDHSMGQHVETFKDHEISLTPEWVFEISGEAFVMERPRKFQSLREAREAISSAVLAYAKEQKAKITLALPALTDTGEDFVIRGINSVSSRILGVEASRGVNERGLYVPSEGVRALLKERMALRKRLSAVEAQLKTARVEASRGYGNLAVEKYDAAIQSLKEEYDRAAQGALTVRVD